VYFIFDIVSFDISWNMAPLQWRHIEIVFSCGVSEIKCIIFNENNDNPYEILNNYIKLSIVFHPMIIFFRK
jgi:hypothetical protein